MTKDEAASRKKALACLCLEGFQEREPLIQQELALYVSV